MNFNHDRIATVYHQNHNNNRIIVHHGRKPDHGQTRICHWWRLADPNPELGQELAKRKLSLVPETNEQSRRQLNTTKPGQRRPNTNKNNHNFTPTIS